MSTSATAAGVRPRVIARSLTAWAVMAVCAVLNGGFREAVLIPRIGEYPGHVLSTLLLVAVVLAVSGLYVARSGTDHARAELLAIGLLWTVATVGFEFLVGAVEGTPVSTTLGQYDVFAGQVWILVPFTLLVAPLLFGRLLFEESTDATP